MIEAQREQALKEKLGQSSKMIWVTFRKEGIHKYPAALTDPKLATGDEYDVSFLGYPHRHIFHFHVAIEVFHDDYKSCEMISDDLYLAIIKRYPGRRVTIEVSEDGENGSKAEYPRG